MSFIAFIESFDVLFQLLNVIKVFYFALFDFISFVFLCYFRDG